MDLVLQRTALDHRSKTAPRLRRLLWTGGLLLVLLAACAAGLVFLLAPASVPVVHPQKGTAIVAVYGSGTVEPVVMLPVAPRIGGRLTQLLADEGADIRKGAVLARLEAEDLRGTVAQLSAQEEFARGDYARNASLYAQGAVSREMYDRARTAFDAARAATAAARAQTGYMTLSAPGDCRVIRRDGEVGQFLAANTPLFWLSCDGALRIAAEIDEEDVSQVAPGQKVLIRADAFAGKIFNGIVTSVTPKGDPVARSYRVRVALPAGTPLQVGMTAETNILISAHRDAMLVPAAAVENGQAMRIVEGRAILTKVRTGARDGDRIEILSGLGADDQVVADIASAPKAGARVTPRTP
jgi:RND family efflux transporter MFP subunit